MSRSSIRRSNYSGAWSRRSRAWSGQAQAHYSLMTVQQQTGYGSSSIDLYSYTISSPPALFGFWLIFFNGYLVKIKEGFGNQYESKEEIDEAAARKIESEEDKKKRHGRHKRKLSDDDDESLSRQNPAKKRAMQCESSSSSDDSSDSDSDENNDDDKKDIKNYPTIPETKLFLSSNIGDKRDRQTNSPAKLPAVESEIVGSFSNKTVSFTEANLSDSEIHEVHESQLRFDLPSSSLPEEAVKSVKDKSQKQEGTKVKPPETEPKASTSHTTDYEDVIEECQLHSEEDRDTYVTVNLELIGIVAVPYVWSSIDLDYIYWPPVGSKVMATYTIQRVEPKTTWKKLKILEKFSHSEDYEGALRTVKAARKLQDQNAQESKQKPKITNEVIVVPPRVNSSKISRPEFDDLSERDMLRVIYNNLQHVETKQNKILTAIQNQPVIQNTGRTAEDRKFEEVHQDISCKSAVDLEKVEQKLVKDKSYEKAFKAHMKSLSSKDGHDLMQKLLSAAMINSLQRKFSFEGKRGKIALNSLHLWSVLTDAAVEKFRDTYAVTDAENTAKDWIKTAKRRIERGKSKTKRKTLQDLLTIEGDEN